VHKEIIKESWLFFIENFKTIAILMIPFIIVTSILSDLLVATISFSQEGDLTLNEWLKLYILFLIKTIFYALDVTLFLYFIKHLIHNLPFSKRSLIVSFLPKLPKVIALTFLASTIIFIGLIFLIIPGVLIALRFTYAWLYIMFEDLNPIKALIKSFKETKAEMNIIVQSLLIIIVPFIIFLLFFFVISGLSHFNETLVLFIFSLISSLVFLFIQVVLYRIYAQYGNDYKG
jgi:hypothetical protein